MKQILQRFVDSEKEQIWNALVSEQIRQKNQLSKKNKIQVNQEEKPTRQRKVA
jgi:hypothetical protein